MMPTAPPADRPRYRFQCLQCGKCCSRPDTIVNLTYSDILRIQFDQGYSFEELLDILGFYRYDHEPSPQELEQMVIPPLQTTQGAAFVGLRKKKGGRCIFLSKGNKCRIYSARPDICRTFPFHFHSTNLTGPKAGLDIQMGYAEKALEYCPGVGGQNPAIDPALWMETGKRAISSILKEVVLIEKWNRATKAGKIQPLAENYLRVVLNLVDGKSAPEGKPAAKQESYQARVQRKLRQQKRKKK